MIADNENEYEGAKEGAAGKRIRLPLTGGEVCFLLAAILVSALLIGLGLWLDPDPVGHGTHTQLGFAPCGYLLRTGRPCFTCGATTAYTLAVHGHPLRALWVQPVGATLFLFNLLTIVYCLDALLRRHSLLQRIALWPWGRCLVLTVLFVLASWAFKLATWESA